MSRYTRLWSLLLVVALLCACPIFVSAEDPGPFHAEVTDPVAAVWEQSERSSRDYVSIAAGTEQMKQHLLARDTAFTLYLYLDEPGDMTQQQLVDLWRSVFYTPMAHTGNPREGDYLDANTKHATGYYSSHWEGERLYLVYTYEVVYYASAQQEALVDAQVARLMEQWDFQDQTDYEKIRIIYDYMAANIVYDDTISEDPTYLPMYSAYAALVEHQAVCQGYASAFYRLALEAGVDARIIFGTAFNGQDTEKHAWNIVKLGDAYYNLDITWDASYAQLGWRYGHFLLCDESFPNHYRGMSTASSAFYDQYPMSRTDYPAEVGLPALPAAAVNGVPCDSLPLALEQAGQGDTVTLLRHVNLPGQTLIIRPDVILDLGGFDLKAEGLVGLTGSLLDADRYNTSGDYGRLLVPRKNLILTGGGTPENDGYDVIPIWNGKNAYVFAQAKIHDTDAGYGLEIFEDSKSLRFTFLHKAGKSANSDFLRDGTGDNALKIVIRLQWENENGTAYQDFVYNDDFVGKVASGGYDYTFTLTGYDLLSIDVSTLQVCALLLTDCGTVTAGTLWSQNNATE